jgi:hypothetical protein
VHPCVTIKRASPLTFVLQPPCTLTGSDTAGAGHHRLIRSVQSSPADVAVAQNDLPPSCATGPGPVVHPASRSMTPPFTVGRTVMIRDLLLMRPPHPRWASAGTVLYAIRLQAWTDSQGRLLGVVLEAAHAVQCTVYFYCVYDRLRIIPDATYQQPVGLVLFRPIDSLASHQNAIFSDLWRTWYRTATG